LLLEERAAQGFTDFGSDLFGIISMNILEPTLELQDQLLIARGKADLPNLGLIPVTLRFTSDETQLYYGITVAIPETTGLDIPFFRVDRLGLIYDQKPGEEPEGVLTGTVLLFNGLEVKLSLEFPLLPDAWCFECAVEAVDIPDLGTLSEWLGIEAFADLLPNGFGEVAALKLSKLAFLFNPETRTLDYMWLSISAESFTMLPQVLNLRNVSVDLQISSPFDSANRSVYTGLAATIQIQDISFPVSASRGGAGDWSLYMEDSYQDELPQFGDLLALFGGDALTSALPEQLTAITNLRLNQLGVEFNEKTKDVSLVSMGICNDSWVVVPDYISVDDNDLSLSVTHPFSSQRSIDGEVYSNLSLGDVNVSLRAEINDTFKFEGVIDEIPLTVLLKEMLGGVTLPEILPDVTFSNIQLSITPAQGDFSFNGTSTMRWKMGDQSIEAAVVLELSRSNGKVACGIAIAAQGPVSIVNDILDFDGAKLAFALNADKSWAITAGCAITMFEHKLTFDAMFEKDGGNRKLTLKTTHTSDQPLINIEGVTSLSYREMGIVVEQSTDGVSAFAWSVFADGGLRIEPDIQIAGRLDLAKTKHAFSINFKPTETQLSLLLLGKQGEMKKDLNAIIALDAFSFRKEKSQWHLESMSSLTFDRLPPQLNNLLNPGKPTDPFKIETVLQVNHKGAELIGRSSFHFEVPFPDVDINGTKLSLGTGAIGISSISIKIGKSIDLTSRLGIALPDRINFILGANDQGKPNIEIFKTYNKDDFEGSCFEIGTFVGIKNVGVNLFSSPLAGTLLTVTREGDSSTCDLDLGECGKLRFIIPEFSIDFTAMSLKAKGGFTVLEPLSIPLGPLKSLLNGMDAKSLSDVLPAKLPLNGVSIYDPVKKEFKHAVLIQLLEGISGNALPNELKTAIEEISKYANLLPDTLKPYLNIEIPQSFYFDLEVTADSSVKCNFTVFEPGKPKDRSKVTPIKALIPYDATTVYGIELYGFSIGQLWSGSLMLVEADLIFDQFNMVEMAASLALTATTTAANAENPFASSKQLHNRFIVEDLFMPVIYQTGVPIPIPLFYDKLGFECTTLVGGNVQAHIGFPRPRLNMMALLKAIANFKKFISDEKYFLSPNNPPNGLDIVLRLPNNFLKLPKYLGGHEIGIVGDFEISSYAVVSQALNLCKKPSIKGLVELIPSKNRVGKIGGGQLLGPIRIPNVQWIITTREEFLAGSLCENIQIPAGQQERALSILPASTHSSEQAIVFIGGTWDMGVGKLDTKFGLIASGENFATGICMDGTVQNIINLHLQGMIDIETQPKARVAIQGNSKLEFAGLEIFESRGLVLIEPDRLQVKGHFHLFKAEGAPFNIQGNIDALITEKSLVLSGAVSVEILPGLFAAQSSIEIDKGGLWVRSQFLGNDANFELKPVYTNGVKEIYLNFSLNSFFSLQNQLWIKNDGSGIRGILTAKVADLSLNSTIQSELMNNQVSVVGASTLSLGTTPLFAGGLKITNDCIAFALSLQIPSTNFFTASTKLEGKLTANSFNLTGRFNVLFSIEGLEIRGSGNISITNEALTSALQIQGSILGISLPPINVKSSFRTWKGRPCFMMAWVGPGFCGGDKHLFAVALDETGACLRTELEVDKWNIWNQHGGLCYSSGWHSWGDDIGLQWPGDLRPTGDFKGLPEFRVHPGFVMSPMYGGTNGTFFIDDLANNDRVLSDLTINAGPSGSHFLGWHEGVIAAISMQTKLSYDPSFPSKQGAKHGGNGSAYTLNSGFSLSMLEPGDHLTSIYIWADEPSRGASARVRGLRFNTTRKSYGIYGAEIGKRYTVPINGDIVGFYGRAGGEIDALGVFTRPPAGSGEVIKFNNNRFRGGFCYGGVGGASFVNRLSETTTPVKKIEIRHGQYINGIRIMGENGDQSDWHGWESDTLSTFVLSSGEFITSLKITAGKYINSLQIFTNCGKTVVFGHESGADFIIGLNPEIERLAGFYGRSGKYIDAIGVITIKIN